MNREIKECIKEKSMKNTKVCMFYNNAVNILITNVNNRVFQKYMKTKTKNKGQRVNIYTRHTDYCQ